MTSANRTSAARPAPETLYEALRSKIPASLDLGGTKGRAQALLIVREWVESHRQEIRNQFDKDGDAALVVTHTSALMDDVIAGLYSLAAERKLIESKKTTGIAVIAVGGYGRGELFPYSDIDILFLFKEAPTKNQKHFAEFMLYVLWDLKLTLGHAVRSLEEAIENAKQDITIRTTLLDARCIAGDGSLFTKFQKRFQDEIVEGSTLEFVEAKLAERDARHHRCGDSRYVLEPNIKEGKGGLRDLQTLYWIARYVYNIEKVSELVRKHVLTAEEYKAFRNAEQFLRAVRVRLHYLAGRAEERLTFDRQREIGEALGYKQRGAVRPVERFMKHYFQTARTVGNLTRTFCSVLEEEKKRKPRAGLIQFLQNITRSDDFVIEGERLAFAKGANIEKNPALLIELFHYAQAQDIDIHPRALQIVTRNLGRINRELDKDPHVNEMLLDILLSSNAPGVTLRRMNDAGALGKLIPDFGRVIGQMQYDMYHVYTVDEHTIFAIDILHGIENGKYKEELPLASHIIHHIKSRRTLFIAMFCHDIAKGRGGDHSILGEKVAYKLATRLGLSAQERETAAWLVRYHLLMSNTAFKRDINDPKTLKDFVEKVQSLERLRLLLILTATDIRAVGPNVWNGWKGALLRELYYRAEAMMASGETTSADERLRQEIYDELQKDLPKWTAEEINDYLDLGNPGFWASGPPSQHARIARMLKEQAKKNLPLVLDTRPDTFHSVTELFVVTPDQHGLFSKVAGVMALSGANIVSCKIFTLKNGIAVEMFNVQDIEGKAYDQPDKIAKMTAMMEKTLAGQMNLDKEFARTKSPYTSRLEIFKVPPGVFIDNNLSATHTVIEVNGRDRIGFLYRITKAISDQGLTISTAHISTYGERAVDVFYVKDVFGMKLAHERKLKQVYEALMQALTPEQRKEAS